MTLRARRTRSYQSTRTLRIRLSRASLVSRTNSNFGAIWTVPGHCGHWHCCASAGRRCSSSTTQAASLSIVSSGAMEIGAFLRIAAALSGAVGQLHGCGLIHKDLKPANVLVDSATGRVQLAGFGIASRLPRERQSPGPPEFIAGTLAYMAPEQTGRVNRSIDSRSDLYSLGVTFYEMLTGVLPFAASDPMEWVHCHIARQPAAPNERLKRVPAAVSAITMKLLSKTAEERYQTAAGVERDLRRCLSQWESQGAIEVFAAGADDTSDRLVIPEKLYGRDHELDTLLTAFDRVVAGGRPELVLVSGYSGIGKSAVVNELHKALVPPRGLFASGKFDQYKRDIPYATLAQAFQSLVRPLLSKNEDDLHTWRDALREALEPNGRLIIDLVPELKHVIGEQPPVPELPPSEAQRRFQLVFRRFISVFARPEHPLALFLDDLQWLDAATLDLLEDLLTQTDLQHLLLIGAYRDNEVSATHPLVRKLDAIRQAGAVVQDIVLTPLGRDDLRQLLADSLHCEPERSDPAGGPDSREDDGKPVLRHPVHFGAGRRGPAHVRLRRGAMELGLASHPRQGLHRQRGRADGRKVESSAGGDPEGPSAVRLHGQQRRVRDAPDGVSGFARGHA